MSYSDRSYEMMLLSLVIIMTKIVAMNKNHLHYTWTPIYVKAVYLVVI